MSTAADQGGTIDVVVVFSPAPREVLEWPLRLPGGSTVRDALAASGLASACPGWDVSSASVGIWGRKAALDQPLRPRDRVEVYRGLRVDPKVARRERFRQQGSRSAGLFARQRPGGKSGY
jgi:putative ubiquitin-RnfH superfamily antitoxin RatB of RatAB toxin-antitoxin module